MKSVIVWHTSEIMLSPTVKHCWTILMQCMCLEPSGTFNTPNADGDTPPLMRFCCQPPPFSPQLCNVFEVTIEHEERTNICKAWNRGFTQLVGHHHHSVFRLLSHNKEDEESIFSKKSPYSPITTRITTKKEGEEGDQKFTGLNSWEQWGKQ